MQTIHPPSEDTPSGMPAEMTAVADNNAQTRVYVQQVRSLRQRVAALEAELAAAKAAEQLSKTPPITSIDFAPATAATTTSAPASTASAAGAPHDAVDPAGVASVFTNETAAPAVVAAVPTPVNQEARAPEQTSSPSPTQAPPAATPPPAQAPTIEPNPGFAEAWGQEPEATFAERVAEKAFFEATSIDEESRNWLLES